MRILFESAVSFIHRTIWKRILSRPNLCHMQRKSWGKETITGKNVDFCVRRIYNECILISRGIYMTGKKAVTAIVFAGVFWGIVGIFVKALSSSGLDVMQVVALRMICAALSLFLVLLLFAPKKLKIDLRHLPLLLGIGFFGLELSIYFYFYTAIQSQTSVAVVLLYTSPAFVLLLSVPVFHEKINMKKTAALLLTVSGCVLVAGLIGGSYTLSPRVLLFGVASGFCYSLYTVFGKFALRYYDSVTVSFYAFLVAAIASLFFADVPGAFSVIAASPSLILPVLGMGIVSSVFPFLLYTYSLRFIDSGKAAILSTVEPLVGAVVGIVAYGEPYDFPKILGILLILSAVLLLNLHLHIHHSKKSVQKETKKAVSSGSFETVPR